METTRHFTATVYIVNGGATALHEHKRLGLRLPPGGHIDRDELPHRAGLREVREETGLDATLLTEDQDVEAPGGRPLPRPRYQMLYDINIHDGTVGHQHIDLIYYATVERREIQPRGDEQEPDAWGWYTIDDLEASDLEADTAQIGSEAIRAARAEGGG